MPRQDIRAILADPTLRRKLCVRVIVATQAREGIKTTEQQAEEAYDRVVCEKQKKSSRKKNR